MPEELRVEIGEWRNSIVILLNCYIVERTLLRQENPPPALLAPFIKGAKSSWIPAYAGMTHFAFDYYLLIGFERLDYSVLISFIGQCDGDGDFIFSWI